MKKYWDQELNWQEIDIEDLLYEGNALAEAAKRLAPEYARMTAYEDLKNCAFESPDDEVVFGTNHVTVMQEQNDACSCHAEYHTYRIEIPAEVLQKYMRGEDWKTDTMKETQARLERERIAAEERARQAQIAADARKRQQELETLAKLKEKYPNA